MFQVEGTAGAKDQRQENMAYSSRDQKVVPYGWKVGYEDVSLEGYCFIRRLLFKQELMVAGLCWELGKWVEMDRLKTHFELRFENFGSF